MAKDFLNISSYHKLLIVYYNIIAQVWQGMPTNQCNGTKIYPYNIKTLKAVYQVKTSPLNRLHQQILLTYNATNN